MLGLPIALARIVSVARVPALAQFPGLCEIMRVTLSYSGHPFPLPQPPILPHYFTEETRSLGWVLYSLGSPEVILTLGCSGQRSPPSWDQWGPLHTHAHFPLGGSLPRANGGTCPNSSATKVGHKLQEQVCQGDTVATKRRLRRTKTKMPPGEFAKGCKLRDLLPLQRRGN